MKALIILVSLFASSFAQSDICQGVPPGEVYLFPYPGDCTRYYECDKGVASIHKCENGLWFNEALQACDHPATSGCINYVCPPNVVDYFPYPNDCNRYIECYQGVLENHFCPTDLWFNRYEKRCTIPSESGCGEFSTPPPWTTPEPTICSDVPPNYIILKPYPGDCSKYYECVGSKPFPMECPLYYYFDPHRQMCDLPERVDCDDTTGTVPTQPPTPPDYYDDPRCADGNADYWPDPDCTKFIECYHYHGYLMSCPSGLYFDPYDKLCEDPSTAHCNPDPETTTKGGDWTPDPLCPWPSYDRYLFPYVGDCTKFWECWYGEKVVENCPDGLYFNPTLLVCDYPWHAGCYWALSEDE